MSSRGGGKPREQEEEDFYDCQETLDPPDPREQEETRQEAAPGSQDFNAETLTDRTDSETGGGGGHQEEQSNRLQEEEQSNRLQEEEQSNRVQEEQGDRLESDRVQEGQGDKLLQEEQSDRLQEEQGDRLQEEQSNRVQEEEQSNRVQEEQGDRLESDRLQEEQGDKLLQEDSDSDLKEDGGRGVEFDDDYLREVEKELTDEEKESRRQQSLTLKEEGNKQFKAGDWSEAERSYTEALGLCPVCFSRDRAVLFSNRAAARLHLNLKDQAISDCTRAIELDPDYLRALLRRAELYEQTEKLDEALEDYKKVLDRDPNQTSARQACMRLPQQIQERNEKLKEEMISKLKDLGNMILRPFGLSTNNFQVNQDQQTGSYSVNFVQNPNNNDR